MLVCRLDLLRRDVGGSRVRAQSRGRDRARLRRVAAGTVGAVRRCIDLEGGGRREYNLDDREYVVDRDLEHEAVAAVVQTLPAGDVEVGAGEVRDGVGHGWCWVLQNCWWGEIPAAKNWVIGYHLRRGKNL